MSFLFRIVREPRVLTQLVRLTEIIRTVCPGVGGVFPFRFGGQAVTICSVVAIEVSSLLGQGSTFTFTLPSS